QGGVHLGELQMKKLEAWVASDRLAQGGQRPLRIPRRELRRREAREKGDVAGTRAHERFELRRRGPRLACLEPTLGALEPREQRQAVLGIEAAAGGQRRA